MKSFQDISVRVFFDWEINKKNHTFVIVFVWWDEYETWAVHAVGMESVIWGPRRKTFWWEYYTLRKRTLHVDAAGGVMDCTLQPILLGRSGQENEVLGHIAQAHDVRNSYKWELGIFKGARPIGDLVVEVGVVKKGVFKKQVLEFQSRFA